MSSEIIRLNAENHTTSLELLREDEFCEVSGAGAIAWIKSVVDLFGDHQKDAGCTINYNVSFSGNGNTVTVPSPHPA